MQHSSQVYIDPDPGVGHGPAHVLGRSPLAMTPGPERARHPQRTLNLSCMMSGILYQFHVIEYMANLDSLFVIVQGCKYLYMILKTPLDSMP